MRPDLLLVCKALCLSQCAPLSPEVANSAPRAKQQEVRLKAMLVLLHIIHRNFQSPFSAVPFPALRHMPAVTAIAATP